VGSCGGWHENERADDDKCAEGDAKVGDCLSANSLPCWGAKPADDQIDNINDNQIDLSQAGFAEGAVNSGTVTDPIAASLLANEFGEAAIDLTASGVFLPGTCQGFGSAFLKSRSSARSPLRSRTSSHLSR
jgi:hypothetical protein